MPAAASAQITPEQRLRAQREQLERIRAERAALQRRMDELQNRTHDLKDEVTLLDRQADATARVVRSLDTQLSAIAADIDSASGNLVRAQDEIVVKRAILRHRLAEIYKRGPLYTTEAILSAESFGTLVARYKYLHQLALRDRALVNRVEELRSQVSRQRGTLVRLQNGIAQNRSEKAQEEQRLRQLEQQRGVSLSQVQAQERSTRERLERIAQSEFRVGQTIASLDAARRRAEARPNAGPAAASTIRTSDLGQLAWPVDGTILYRFGRVVNPNNTTTRWNGIGISAPVGTPVKAISSGTVAVAEAIGTYGLTVIVQHGGGDYSVYGSLARIDVRRGATVRKGQLLGTVGATDPELEAHLHFEIRRERGKAVDPLEWLRGQR